MKKNKIFYSIILAILVIFILYVYNGFNGNPVSKYASKKALKKYLSINYPAKNLRIKDNGTYNFKFTEYDFKVLDLTEVSEKKDDPQEYEFSIRGFIKLKIVNDPIRNDSIDQVLSQKLSDEASRELTALLSQKVNNIKDVYVSVEVFKNQYDSSTAWNKNLKLSDPISMHIVIDSANASRQDIYEAAVNIQNMLDQYGYEYRTVNINGNIISNSSNEKDKMGYLKYSLAFKKDSKLKISDVKEIQK